MTTTDLAIIEVTTEIIEVTTVITGGSTKRKDNQSPSLLQLLLVTTTTDLAIIEVASEIVEVTTETIEATTEVTTEMIEATIVITGGNTIIDETQTGKEGAGSQIICRKFLETFQNMREDVCRMKGFFQMIVETLASVQESGCVKYAAC